MDSQRRQTAQAAAGMADDVLVSLQQHLNTIPPGAEIGVVLTLPGICVTGRMVSAETWAAAAADLADAGAGAGQPSEVARYLRQIAEPWTRSRQVAESEDDAGSVDVPQFVHLLGAQFLSGGALLPGVGMPWRGRLDNVAGWSYGLMCSE